MTISSKRLRARTIRWRQWQAKGSLFPLFRPDGTIRFVLLVLEDGGLRLLRWEHGAVRIPFFGRVSVADGASLRDIRDHHDADSVAGLWHFDPQWLLAAERFTDHPAAPLLKATNCALSFPDHNVQGMSYRKDLRAVAALHHTVGGEGVAESWSAQWLRASSAARETRRSTWTLAPSWPGRP